MSLFDPACVRYPIPYMCEVEVTPSVVAELLYCKHQFCISQKLDGIGVTYLFDSDPYAMVSAYDRNNAQIARSNHQITSWKATDPRWRWINEYFKTTRALYRPRAGFALQGELCGPGINGNPLELNELMFYLVDVYDTHTGSLMDVGEAKEHSLMWGIPYVPWVYHSHLPATQSLKHPTDPDDMFAWLHKLSQFDYTNTTNPGEGLVVRTVNPMRSRSLVFRFTFKVTNPVWKDVQQWQQF